MPAPICPKRPGGSRPPRRASKPAAGTLQPAARSPPVSTACDSLTGALLGQRATGEHTEAVDLLTGAGADGRQAARQLSQLLPFKTPAQYDPAPLS